MGISNFINPKILNIFSLSDFIAYMTYLSGWHKVKSKSGWHVFVSDDTVAPVELEIILPDRADDYAAPTQIASALDLLANLREEDPEILAQNIAHYESDLFYIRNTNIDSNNSVELDVAAKQIQYFNKLIKQAADMEIRRKPYDLSTHSADANKLASHYRFGHTFRGSFGFTLNAPLKTQAEKSIQQPFLLDTQTVPLSRRVLERIARGLISVNESVKEKSSERIVSNYLTGLNANMCASLFAASLDYKFIIEYKITWSPIIRVTPEADNFTSILVDTPQLTYIEKAEDQLKSLEEAPLVTVRGLVNHVGTTDAPLSDNAKRTITMTWLNNPYSKRPTKLTMKIDAHDYQIAHSANLNWDTIFVEGIPQAKTTGWVLDNPTNFRIAEDEDVDI